MATTFQYFGRSRRLLLPLEVVLVSHVADAVAVVVLLCESNNTNKTREESFPLSSSRSVATMGIPPTGHFHGLNESRRQANLI